MKPIRIFATLLALVSLAGCTIPTGDDLLAVPRASKNYKSLQLELEQILAKQQSYVAPVGGENRSTVQLVDLDGDGVEEAISFFRKSANANEFSVYVHQKRDDNYALAGSFSGTGTAIASVEYPVITPDGRRGIVIAWKLAGAGQGALTMCDLDALCAPRVLLETEYSAMELTDLTGNGAKDLLLIAADSAGKRNARLYQYAGGTLALAGETATSQEAVTVVHMSSGRAGDSLPAVFAEQKTESGVGLLTDIFVYSDGALRNLALDSEDTTARGTYRPVSVYASDCNADGVTEVPRAVLMAGYTDAAAPDAIFMIDWYAYGVTGTPKLVQTTYQNVSEEWSLLIDDAWHDRITAVKTSENGLGAVHFSQYLENGEKTLLFSIYSATGTLSDYYAARDDLVQLGRTNKAVFFARIAENTTESDMAVDAESLKNRFSIVTQAWNNS